MLFELISEEDKAKITNYIDQYSGAHSYVERAPLEKILKPWETAKSLYLAEPFKEGLIQKRRISFTESVDEIRNKIIKGIKSDEQIRKFFQNYRTKINDIYYIPYYQYKDTEENQKKRDTFSILAELDSEYVLAENQVDVQFLGSNSIKIEFPNGNTYTIQHGAKPMRVLRVVAENLGLDLEAYERLRTMHSMAHNTKSLEGELCISIHPLDFMTMSDNAEDWSSCMSWKNNGEYRQGTVEMMNSPTVVVAYLTSDKPYHFPYSQYTWNSKRWRCLFILDHDCVVSVREYPYRNSNLVRAAAEQIAQLYGKKPEEYDVYTDMDVDNTRFRFNTEAMYNDMDQGYDDHCLIVPKDMDIHDGLFLDFDYSGPSECMWCGDTSESYVGDDQEQSLCCSHCGFYNHCEECGCRLGENSGVWIGDWVYCQDCAEEVSTWDEMVEETIFNDDAVTIMLSAGNEEDKYSRPHKDGVWESELVTAEYQIGSTIWNRYFNIPEPRVDTRERYNVYFVNIADCTDTALRDLFELKDREYATTYYANN